MDNNNSSKRGIGVVGLLQVALIVLKLCNVIKWSWVWVLAPTWIDIALFIIIVAIYETLRRK